MLKQDLLNSIKKVKIFNNSYMDFDIENHIYLIEGNEKISVTQFIEQLKSPEEIKHFHSKKFQAFMKPYAIFGSFIHKETEKLDVGHLLKRTDYNNDQYIALLSYQSKIKLLKEQGFDIVAIELPFYSHHLDICGTIDRLFFNETTGEVLLADIKTGKTRKEHWYQQLTYKSLMSEWGIYVDNIALISLKMANEIPVWNNLEWYKKEEILNKWNKLI